MSDKKCLFCGYPDKTGGAWNEKKEMHVICIKLAKGRRIR